MREGPPQHKTELCGQTKSPGNRGFLIGAPRFELGTSSLRGWGFATPPSPIRDVSTELAAGETAKLLKVLHPSRLPSKAPFWLVIHDKEGTNREIVQVTSVQDAGYIVERGQLGTTPALHRYLPDLHLSPVELICAAGDQPLTIQNPPPSDWIWIDIPWDGSDATFKEYDSNQRDLPAGSADKTKQVPPTEGVISSEEPTPGPRGRGEPVFDGPWWLLYTKTTVNMARLGGTGDEWLPQPLTNWFRN